VHGENAGKIDSMAPENERLPSANQQLIEANELSAIDRQDLHAGQEHFEVAMTPLDRHAEEFEAAMPM
jgi:hypothetical protein